MMLLGHKAMMARTAQGYKDMTKRFGPKCFASGPRKGQLRHAGRTLPFSLEEFRDRVCDDLSVPRKCGNDNQIWNCRTMLTFENYVIDHALPVSRGGGIGLDNLQLICADCNNVKGDLTWEEYLELRRWLTTCTPHIEKSVLSRLRTVGSALQMRRVAWARGNKKPPAAPAPTYDDPNF